MKKRSFLGCLILAVLPVLTCAQVVDRVLLGQAESEQQHGLTVYCPDNVSVVTNGFLNQTGRASLMFEENPFAGSYPGIYGGEFSCVLRVDGTAQNYLTLRTYGGDGVTKNERYRVQVDNKDLMDYSRDAASFDTQKAPGAFSFQTIILPRKVTDGKEYVVVRVRGVGRYYAYGTQRVLTTFQRVMEGDLPPIYAIYTSTNPMFSMEDEVKGQIKKYSEVGTASSDDLDALRTRLESGFNSAMSSQLSGSDFKPAYGNNNFNIVEAMGTAYQRGYYGGGAASKLASKIRVAIDSLVYIDNVGKRGTYVNVSALGNTKTEQRASAGWGGLYGNQGYGMYSLWRAGQVTDFYLDKEVDLGRGTGRTRRAQWIDVFKESFDHGCTYSGRRQITNQAMEGAYSVYGAALALYALDKEKYHNAPKLALRFLREAAGLEVWTGVPKDCSFDGTVTDAEGYPDFVLGDSMSTDSKVNFWGCDFHVMTEKGNGREGGWTCTSCYGKMGPRLIDMYLITKADPYIGTAAGGEGDREILERAVTNEKSQAYFTVPWVASDGKRQISSESATCWRNRYNPGRPYYGNLIVAGLSGDEELLGHVWQSYKEGRLQLVEDMTNRLFNYYSRNYWLPECIDKLKEYGAAHASDYQTMPSTPGNPDYVFADEQAGIVAVKHGDNHLFVNFYSETGLGSCGRVHVITPTEERNVSFIPDVMDYVPSGKQEVIPEEYWNGNHQITYPDRPVMADAGTAYDIPSYDGVAGHYNTSRTLCRYYQQCVGNYLVAQNTTKDRTYPLTVPTGWEGQKVVNVATGDEVTLVAGMEVAPRTSVVYYLASTAGTTVMTPEAKTADVTALAARAAELTAFAQTASKQLSTDKTNGTYSRDAFMPFFNQVTTANYMAHAGIFSQEEVDSMLTVLNAAYDAFAGTLYLYDPCAVPGDVDYRKKVAQNGGLQVSSATKVVSAMKDAWMLIPIQAAEAGDYTVKVMGRGHVADSKEPGLNVDFFTPAQYENDEMAFNAAYTQQMDYNDVSNSAYRWFVHLEAGELKMMKLTFTANTSGYTVDLGKLSIAASTDHDRLLQDVARARAMLVEHEDNEMVTDAQRNNLQAAIDEANMVSSKADADTIVAARETLQKAIATFLAGMAEWKYPTADIQFRINNTAQSGTGASFEIHHSASGTSDYAFVGGIRFDISKLQGLGEIQSASLRLTTIEKGCQVSVRPFSPDWGEAGKTTDSYAARQALITEAVNAEEVCQFSAKLGGGKKMFEWVPSADYTYTVADWQVETDVTASIRTYVDAGKTDYSILLIPANESGARTIVMCKDASAATYGSSTTDDYYLEGDKIGQKNGQSVTRWSRIEQVLAQDGSPVSALYPMLTVEIEGVTGVQQVQIAGDALQVVRPVDVYDLGGRLVRTKVRSDKALQGLSRGIYVVDGKKYQVR